MFKMMQLFLTVLVLISVVSCLCPNGWTRYNDSCYYIGYGHTVSFTEAEHYCRQHHNSHLIHVETEDENTFIKDVLRKTSASYCWVGLTDMDTEGKWVWYDTNDVPDYTYWAPGEPAGGDVEDCAVYAAHHTDYRWDDYPCGSKFHPICETSGNIDVIVG